MGAFMTQGIALRGALVRGPLYASPQERLYVGKSLVKAYDLGQNQDWAGAALDPALATWLGPSLKRLDADGAVMRHVIPMKRQHSPRVRYALGWPLGLVPSGSILLDCLNSRNPAMGEARRKLVRAAAFADEYREKKSECEPHRFLQAMARISGR